MISRLWNRLFGTSLEVELPDDRSEAPMLVCLGTDRAGNPIFEEYPDAGVQQSRRQDPEASDRARGSEHFRALRLGLHARALGWRDRKRWTREMARMRKLEGGI